GARGLAAAARKLAPRGGAAPRGRQAIVTGVAARGASLAYALSFPLRELLFNSSESEALPPPVRIARDTLLGLAIALPLAALGASLVLSDRRTAKTWKVSRSRAILLAGSAALLAAASLGAPLPAAHPPPP